MWFSVVCTLIDNDYGSLLLSQTFFSYRLCMLSDVSYFSHHGNRHICKLESGNETLQNEAFIQRFWALLFVRWLNTHNAISKWDSRCKNADLKSIKSHLNNIDNMRSYCERVECETYDHLPSILASNVEIIIESSFLITYDTFCVISSPKTIFKIFEIVLTSFEWFHDFEANFLDEAKNRHVGHI